MMDTQVDRELLEKIADLVGKPVGAFSGRPLDEYLCLYNMF